MQSKILVGRRRLNLFLEHVAQKFHLVAVRVTNVKYLFRNIYVKHTNTHTYMFTK